MQIPFGKTTAMLHGHDTTTPANMVFQLLSVQEQSAPASEIQTLRAEIQAIHKDFATVCSPPQQLLPLVRSCDHRIPLISGARPMNTQR